MSFCLGFSATFYRNRKLLIVYFWLSFLEMQVEIFFWRAYSGLFDFLIKKIDFTNSPNTSPLNSETLKYIYFYLTKGKIQIQNLQTHNSWFLAIVRHVLYCFKRNANCIISSARSVRCYATNALKSLFSWNCVDVVMCGLQYCMTYAERFM